MGICLHRITSPRPPVQDVSEQVMALPVSGGIPLHNASFKIVYFLGGAARLRVDGEENYLLSAGDVMVLPRPCRQEYRRASEQVGTAHTLIFRLAPGSRGVGRDAELARYLREHFPRPRHLRAPGRYDVRELVARLRREAEVAPPAHAEATHEIVRQFVFLIAELLGIHRVPPRPAAEERIEAACTAALQSGQPPEGGPAFRRRMGVAPARFLAGLRVEQAREEMVHASAPLSVVARRAGFPGLSAFSRTFRALAGMAPSEYRQRLQNHQRLEAIPPGEPLLVGEPYFLAGGPEWVAPGPSLLLAMGGEGEARSGRRRMPLAAGEPVALYARPGSRWQFPGLHLGVVPLRKALSGGGGVLALPRGRELQEACRYLPLLDERGPAARHARLAAASFLKSAALELLRLRAGAAGGNGGEGAGANRLPVDYAREYIQKNLAHPLRLSEIAWFAGVSEEHLARSFRAVTGQTAFAFLRACRVRRAATLLAELPQMTLAEVAEKCGFANAALLCRVFKAETGLTPGAFRKKPVLQRIINTG